MFRYIYITISLLLINTQFCSAQDEKNFLLYRNYLQLAYEKPEGFEPFDLPWKYFYYLKNPMENRHKAITPLTYHLTSSDSSIMIGIYIRMLDTTLDHSRLMQLLNPGITQNTGYKLTIRNHADTINDKVVFYPVEECRNRFNADFGFDFGFTMEVPYLHKYPYCQLQFIQQNDLGNVEIYYFYTEKDNEQVKALLAKAECMIWFKSFTERPKARIFHGQFKD